MQNCARDVVDEVCGTHLAAAAEQTPASVGVLEIANGACCRIDDGLKINEVLYGRCGHHGRHEDDASDKHGGLGVCKEHSNADR